MKIGSIDGGIAPPPVLAVNPDGAPDYMKGLNQWINWRLTWNEARSAFEKTPFQTNGRLARSNDWKTWTSFDAALGAYYEQSFSGLGFCLSEHDLLTVIDLDHCIDMNTGVLDVWAQEIVDRFTGTYIEKSPSGDGLHIWCHGEPGATGVKKITGASRKQQIEVYRYPSHRYMTVTGCSL